MWFIFPQLRGLGFSEMSETYGIASLEEAKAYLIWRIPFLGPVWKRQRAAYGAASSVDTLKAIFGSIDALKFCSSMTLFAKAAESGSVYAEVVRGLGTCERTLQLLAINKE